MTPPREKATHQQLKRKQSSSQPTLISNYFKKIDSPTEKRVRSAQPTIQTNDDPTSRVLYEDEETPVSKRPRLQTPPNEVGVGGGSGEVNALTALMSPKVKEFRPPPESPRTARYKYLSLSSENGEDSASPEELAKKKSLHEKFVQKLGRPESLASIRRASMEGTPLEEETGAEDEEEEEEVAPAAKTLRGKYAAKNGKATIAKPTKTSAAASKAKLTPLERQYVEIKKEYPDTLLLIEVGYKFRFFGEDAKVSIQHYHTELDCFEGAWNCSFHEP
jgi:DNA mismatch repair protein MSH3